MTLAIPAPMQAPHEERAPFTSPDWIFELRFEGARCLALVDGGAAGDAARVRLRGEDGADCTGLYPGIVRALADMPGGPHVIDGQACRLHGRTDFALFAFDLPVHDGVDITRWPLMQRKAVLSDLLAAIDAQWAMPAGHLPADAGLLRMMATGAGSCDAPSVVARRKDSPYLPGQPSTDWVRIVLADPPEGQARVWQ